LSEAAEVQHEDWNGEGLGAAGLSQTPTADITEPPAKRPPALRFVFMGPSGLRPGWGLLLFVLIFLALGAALNITMHKLHPVPVKTAEQRKAEAAAGQKPSAALIGEGSAFALVALTSWIMGRIERRPVGRYGFGGRRKIARFAAGFTWGFLFLAALVGALWKAGLLVFDGRLLFGAQVWRYGAIWLLGFLLVGLFEEYLLRGYLQYTISRGAASLYGMLFETKHCETLGFWTAAAALSFVFGFGHGSNPGESAIGLWSAGLIGLIFCFTLWKTGSLWWALGFHAAWDWAQSFVFGVADSGTMVQGHLYASHPVGKVLLSGGATGPEGSALILPVLAVITLVAMWTLPRREWSIDGASS
jgi:membrane protease YdiL (CAAX protease family)